MRYLVALVVAAVLIAGLALFARQTFRDFEGRLRQSLREQKEAGTLPPQWRGIDVETVDVWSLGFQMKVSREQQSRLHAAMILSDVWFVWAPAVVLLCLAAAFVIGRFRGRT
jgi:hypothetical protein